MWALVILAVELVLVVAGYGLVLRFCARRLGYRRTTFGQAVGTALLIVCAGVVLEAVGLMLPERVQVPYEIAIWPAQWLIMALLLMWLHTSWWRWAAAGVAVLAAAQLCVLALTLLVLRPLVMETTVTRTEAMAPTLLSTYKTGTCLFCGGPLLVPTNPGADPSVPVMSTCEECWRGSLQAPGRVNGDVTEGDRFVVVKLLSPDRWDLVTLRVNGERWVRRVVGVPGDTVSVDMLGEITNSSVGMSVDPQGLTRRFPWPEGSSVSAKLPMHLGADEYFVVADNSGNAQDSRQIGPVKSKDIEGVVTLLYWPAERARFF